MTKKSTLLLKLSTSLLRIAIALCIVLSVPTLFYYLWKPGAINSEGKLNQGQNAIWLEHGWLGDDAWFARNSREISRYRSFSRIVELMRNLKFQQIRFVYPHLCPAQFSGEIAPYNQEQVERFLDVAEEYDIIVIPWVGGVLGESARIENRRWRTQFAASIQTMLSEHPRLGGVQINIEPLPSMNQDFLLLLEELRPILKERILGVAAYPPPTRWQMVSSVHWELPYLTEVAKRSDQMAVMMYDTSIKLEKFYIKLMCEWTQELQNALANSNCSLLLGIPAYEDSGVKYHYPEVENLYSSLLGINAANPGGNYIGCAIYCQWEVTPEKWKTWRSLFLGQTP
ncbi:MAG: hypothetical protein LBM70_10155 [Victivallales bacterium]|jgi:hypothetical protein|nr:hypothetical protein [Victivallales bacterium]